MRLIRRLRRLLLQLARTNSSKIVGEVWLAGLLAWTRSPGPLARRFADEIQPDFAVFNDSDLPTIQVVMASTRKDFDVLPATIASCVQRVSNPIDSVHVVVPDDEIEDAIELGTSAIVVGENALLPLGLVEVVRRHHPPGRFGWILQQVIGLYFAWSSESAGVLVLDSDTILSRPRAFLGRDRKQLLSLSHEYFERYEDHAAQVWGARRRHRGLSYVTHHQLMQPWVLREMFPKLEDLANWVLKATTDHNSTLSEYHSYGRWLFENCPDLVSLARWGNKGVARHAFGSLDPKSLQREISARFPHYFSVSLHSYLR